MVGAYSVNSVKGLANRSNILDAVRKKGCADGLSLVVWKSPLNRINMRQTNCLLFIVKGYGRDYLRCDWGNRIADKFGEVILTKPSRKNSNWLNDLVATGSASVK